ncbi:MAG: cupin domain-containing protein [Deltaproteobacteria bacterium]|nr:cupin domain-containing protein [Deltaproteobacteria bacterium]
MITSARDAAAVVRLGEEEHAIAAGDIVYVSPNEIHQFKNPGPEILGFLCVVPSAHH